MIRNKILLSMLFASFLPNFSQAYYKDCTYQTCGYDAAVYQEFWQETHCGGISSKINNWTEEKQDKCIEQVFGEDSQQHIHQKFKDTYLTIKTAIAHNKKEVIANLIRYPAYYSYHTITFNESDGTSKTKSIETKEIKDKSYFLLNYNNIITNNMKQIIINSDYKFLGVTDYTVDIQHVIFFGKHIEKALSKNNNGDEEDEDEEDDDLFIKIFAFNDYKITEY